MTADAQSFLMGGGVPSAKFDKPGDSVSGPITTKPELMQQRDFASGDPLVWDDGTPRMQLKVIIDTGQTDPDIEDDDGLRALYLKRGLLTAVRSALRKAGCRDLEVGGNLTVTYVGDGEAIRGLNPPKLYSAVYTQPPTKLMLAPEPGTADDDNPPF
jgi:hypothetical protein